MLFYLFNGGLLKILLLMLLITFSLFGYDKEFGANNCAQCHSKIYENWKKSVHFKTADVLTEKDKKNPKCVSCHKPSKKDVGVGCESCHGEGKHYAKDFVMKDKKLSKMLGLKKVTQKTCNKCHNKSTIKGTKNIKEFKACGEK